jgi:hypothetical protein
VILSQQPLSTFAGVDRRVHSATTPYAKTTIPNLTLLTLYGFRVKVTIGTTTGASTHPVMLLVH